MLLRAGVWDLLDSKASPLGLGLVVKSTISSIIKLCIQYTP